MSNLFLIAHKVRGEPAFDVALQMSCPLCESFRMETFGDWACDECDTTGHWWIIPTSGHRAYPFVATDLKHLYLQPGGIVYSYHEFSQSFKMPPDLPDHYTTSTASSPKAAELIKLFKTKVEPIGRRPK